MGLTSCRWIRIAANCSTPATRYAIHLAGCPVPIDRAADRYTLICDEPVELSYKQIISADMGQATAGASSAYTTRACRPRPRGVGACDGLVVADL